MRFGAIVARSPLNHRADYRANIVGLGIGLSSGTVPVYISEVSPPAARGWTVSIFQLAITVGFFLAYVVDYAFASIQGWRWMLGLAVVPAAIFAIGMIFLPESPRWLARKGHHEAARKVLGRIRTSAGADSEMKDIEAALQHSEERGRLSDLLHPSLRAALVVGIGLAILQQITGINTVIYYAPLIIQSAGIPSASGAILATAGIGVVNVLMTIVSMWLIDRAGRRPLLLTGIAGMIVTLFALGYAFHSPMHGGSLGSGRCHLHDAVRRIFRHQSRAHFLAFDFRNISAHGSQFGGGSFRYLQLGRESPRFAHFPYAASINGREPYILAVRSVRHRCMDFLLLFGSGNQRQDPGGNRGVLAQAPIAPKTARL